MADSVFSPGGINKMGRGGGERIPDHLKLKYGLTDAEYGNSFRYEASMLHHHWDLDHNGDFGDQSRVYSCMVCRGLGGRVSSLLAKGGPLKSYSEVVELVRTAAPMFIQNAIAARANAGAIEAGAESQKSTPDRS